MTKSRRVSLNVTVVVAATTVAAAIGLTLAFLGGGLPGSNGSYRLRTVVPNAAALAPGARVTMAGAQVGRVTSVKRVGTGAELGLAISDEHVSPLPADSAVEVRVRTPVGENYVSIARGHSRTTLPDNGFLALGQRDDYVDVDQILSQLRGQGGHRMRDLVQGLGRGLQDREQQLNTTLGDAAATGTNLARLTDVAYANREQLSRLIEQFGDVTRAIGDRGAAVQRLGGTALAAFSAVAARDAALRAGLRELPSTLTQVRATTARLGSITGTTAPVVENLSVALHDLRPAVSVLQPAAIEGRATIDELGRAAGPLSSTLRHVQRLSGTLPKALPQVRQVLCQVNPAVRYLAPYTRDLTAVVTSFGSAVNAYDAVGHTLRVMPVFNDSTAAGTSDATTEATHQLIENGLAQKLLPQTFYAYPRPGHIGDDDEGRRILGPDEYRDSGYKYPRIHADC